MVWGYMLLYIYTHTFLAILIRICRDKQGHTVCRDYVGKVTG